MTNENVSVMVIDAINTFYKDGELVVPKAEEINRPINTLLAHAKRQGWKIVNAREDHTDDDREHYAKWGRHGVRGTVGVEVHPDLAANLGEAIQIYKGADPIGDGYDGFGGKTRDGKTTDQVLKENHIRTNILVGLALDYCVKESAISSVRNGYRTILCLDGTRAVNLKPDDGERAIKELKHEGVIISTTEEVVSNRVNLFN